MVRDHFAMISASESSLPICQQKYSVGCGQRLSRKNFLGGGLLLLQRAIKSFCLNRQLQKSKRRLYLLGEVLSHVHHWRLEGWRLLHTVAMTTMTSSSSSSFASLFFFVVTLHQDKRACKSIFQSNEALQGALRDVILGVLPHFWLVVVVKTIQQGLRRRAVFEF